MWMVNIGVHLKGMYKEEARKNFNKWCAEGNKLSFKELQDLKDEDWKYDYIMHQLLEDDVIQELLVQQQKIIEKEYEEIYEARD